MHTMENWKRLIPALAIILILLQGCSRAAMENAIALGDHPEPGSLQAQAIGSEQEANQQCKVVALGGYCLGGEIKELLESKTPYKQREKGALTEFDFRDKYWLVTVSVYNRQIMSVRREERPARSSTLRSLKTQIDQRYGGGEDHSTFPPGLESSRDREYAIYSNRAEALMVWEKAGWRIRLQWKGRDPIQLIFEDTELLDTYLADKS